MKEFGGKKKTKKQQKDRRESYLVLNNINMKMCKSNTYRKNKDFRPVNNCCEIFAIGL